MKFCYSNKEKFAAISDSEKGMRDALPNVFMQVLRTRCGHTFSFFLTLFILGSSATGALADIVYFTDSFERTDSNSSPWVAQTGSFGVTNGALQGTTAPEAYGFAYYPSNWTDYSVEATIRFSSSNALGAGVGARLNPTTGAHYAAWVYPENSIIGARMVRLVKFTGWGSWSGVAMASASVPSVGTNAHQLRMTLTGNLISLAFDGATLITVADNNAEGVPPFTSGGITMDMYADANAPYTFAIDDVKVSTRPLVTITPNSVSRSFGDTNPGVSVVVSGLLGSDAIQASPVLTADALTPAGVYPISASVIDTNLVLTNYTVITNQGALTITPSPSGILFRDEFARASDPAGISPWTLLQGSYGITNGMLRGTGGPESYSYAYIPNSTWSNYFVSAQIRFSSTNAWGGGLGGRLNPLTGAHYGVWVYPDNSQGGVNTIKLIKFRTWTTWSGTPLAVVTIPATGTNTHVLSVSFQDNRVRVNFDSTPAIDVTDNGFDDSAALASGGITADMFTDAQSPYVLSYDNLVVQQSRPVLTLTTTNSNRTYGGTNPVFSVHASGITNGDNISVTAVCSATTNSSPGIYAIVPVLVDPDNKAPNYEVQVVNGALTIVPASLSISVNDTNRQYGELNPAFSASFSGFANDESPSVLGGVLEFSTPATSSSSVGTYPIVAAGLTSSNYAISFIPGTLTIAPFPLFVTPDDKSRLYGAENPALTGRMVGIQNSDLITATYSTPAGANSPFGNYVIAAQLEDPGNKLGNYLITTNTGTLSVLPAPLLVTAESSARLYGQTNPIFSATYSGLVNDETPAVLQGQLSLETTADANSPVGTYAIVPSGLFSTNYTLSYSNGVLTVAAAALSVTADDRSRLYGAENPKLTGQISGVQNGDSISAAYSTSAATNSPAGTYEIVPQLLDPSGKLGNYSVTTNNGTLDVLPAPLLVALNSASRAYGSTNPPFSAAITGFVNGEDASILAGSLQYLTSAEPSSPIGDYVISASGLDSPNYSLTYSNGTLTITTAPLSVNVDNQTRLYGATNPPLSGLIIGLQNADDITASYSTAADTNSPIGNYTINVGLTDPAGKLPNYTVVTNLGILAVGPAPLLVAVNNSSRAYGHTNPVFSSTFTGFVNSETEAVLGGALVYSTIADTNSPIGNYDVSASGLTSTNYNINYANGILTIAPFELIVTPDNNSRVYGAQNPTLTGQISGVQNGDLISATYSSSAATNSPPGTYLIIPELLDPNGKLTNYSVTTNNGTLSVLAAPLVVSVNNAARAYGSTNPPFSANLSGFVNGEDSSVLAGALHYFTSAEPSSPIGDYVISASGLDSSNYSLTFSNGTLTVMTAPLSVNVDNQARLYGAANPPLTGSITGLQNADDITANYSTAADTNSPTGNYTINVGLTDPAGKLPNYSVVTNVGTLTVGPAPLLVAVNNSSRAYGHTNPLFSSTFIGFVNSEDEAILGGALLYNTVADTNSPIGNYEVAASGLTSTNYDINYTNGILTVTPFELIVTPDNTSRVYGAENPTLTGQISGLQNGDSISATYSTSAATNSPVGNYDIIASLNDAGNKLTNYAVTTNMGTLAVLPAALLVRANDTNRLYGQSEPGFNATFTGFANGEDASVLGGALTLNTTAEATSSVGAYPIIPAGLVSSNYSITFSNGVLTIAQFPLQFTIDNKTRLYGASNPTFTSTLTGVQNGDVITPSYSTVATPNSGVGVYPITGQLIDPGSRLSNYSVVTNGATLTITQGSTTLALTSSSQGVAGPNAITFNVQVSPLSPSFVPAQGAALLFVNGVLAGQTSTFNNGLGHLTLALLPGTNQLVAAYLGDANYGPSIGSMSQVVSNSSRVVAAPVAVSIVKNTDATVTVTFSGTAGIQYTVQATSTLQGGSWTTVGTGLAGEDGKWTFTEAISGNPTRFYRAVIP
jgi:hypothetical protein